MKNRYPCNMCGYVYSSPLSAERCEDADRLEEETERRHTHYRATHRGVE